MLEIENRVRAFIVENFLFGDESRAPDPEASFLEMRLLDSTGVLELVGYLEETFGIRVGESDLTPENLDSIRRIAEFVTRSLDGA